MKKKVLLTPGPTPIPPEVLAEISRPIIHHRTDEYVSILGEVFSKLKKIFFTQRPVLLFSSSGTGAMEAAVSNFVNTADKVLVIEGGKFGERWGEILSSFGVKNVIRKKVEWGDAFSAQELERVLSEEKDIRAVFSTLCETSTGTVFDIQGYARVLKNRDAILIVDAISGLLSDPLYMDEWAVDVVVCGSQKGLMLPPGLGFIALSPKAEQFLERSDLPHYYFDIKKHLKSYGKTDTPFTSSVSLVRGLNRALDLILEQGVEKLFGRARIFASALRESFKNVGLEILSRSPSQAVTAVKSPVDSQKLVKLLRTEYGVSVAGGQGKLKGEIFRVAHMGYIDENELLSGLYYLEKGLKKLGFSIKPGVLVSKFLEVLYEGSNKR